MRNNRMFLAFCLDELQSECTGAQVKVLGLDSMAEAKAFLRRYYPDFSWVVVDKRIIDRGLVFRSAQEKRAA
jgi:hypothetical protein